MTDAISSNKQSNKKFDLFLNYFFLFTLLTSFSQAKSITQCHSLYINKPTTLDLIVKNLTQNPNGSPLLIISDALTESFMSLTENYEQILKAISAQGTDNLIGSAILTTTSTLETFHDLNKKLSDELTKSKPDRNKIETHANDLKLCLNNIKHCDVNLRSSLLHVDHHIHLTQELLLELERKTEELNDVIPSLKSTAFPLDLLNEIDILIEHQKKVILDGYRQLLLSSIDTQKNLKKTAETYIALQIPTAKLQAQLLQTKPGVPDMGTFSSAQTAQHKDNITDPRSETFKKLGIQFKNTNVPGLSDAAARFQQLIDSSEISAVGKDLLENLYSEKIKTHNFLTWVLNAFELSENPYFSARDIAEIAKYHIDNISSVNMIEPRWTFANRISLNFKSKSFLPNKEMSEAINYQLFYFLSQKINYPDYESFVAWIEDYIQSKINSSKDDFEKVATEVDSLNKKMTKISFWKFSEKEKAAEQLRDTESRKYEAELKLKRYEYLLKEFIVCTTFNQNKEKLAFQALVNSDQPSIKIGIEGESNIRTFPVSVKKGTDTN